MRIRGTPAAVSDLRNIRDLASLPYILVYRVKEESIEVLRIYHAAQDMP